jgi:hypothetical protein
MKRVFADAVDWVALAHRMTKIERMAAVGIR